MSEQRTLDDGAHRDHRRGSGGDLRVAAERASHRRTRWSRRHDDGCRGAIGGACRCSDDSRVIVSGYTSRNERERERHARRWRGAHHVSRDGHASN